VDNLEIENVTDPDGHFEQILSLCRGGTLEVTSANVATLLRLAAFLVNRELSEAIVRFCTGDEELSLSNVIERLLVKSLHSADFSSEVEFIASHLSEFDAKSLRVLDVALIDEIISSESVRIENEDFLLDLVARWGI
jgi:hypothetical protein